MLKGLLDYNKHKKIILILGIAILSIIILLIIPKSKADIDSIVGKFYIFIGQYDKGISKLSDNPSHSNNFETIIDAKYKKGVKYYKKEDYYNAQLTFNEILSYKHSKIWYSDSVYQIGRIYYANKLYKDALNYFSKIEDYNDSYVYMMLCKDSLYNLSDFNNFVITAAEQYEVYKVFTNLGNYDDVNRRLEDNKYILAKLNSTWIEKTDRKLNLALSITDTGVTLNHNFTLPGGVKNNAQIIINDNVIGLGLSSSDYVPIFKIEKIDSSTLEIFSYGNNQKYTMAKE